ARNPGRRSGFAVRSALGCFVLPFQGSENAQTPRTLVCNRKLKACQIVAGGGARDSPRSTPGTGPRKVGTLKGCQIRKASHVVTAGIWDRISHHSSPVAAAVRQRKGICDDGPLGSQYSAGQPTHGSNLP